MRATRAPLTYILGRVAKTRLATFRNAAPTASAARNVARTPQHTTATRVNVRDSCAHTGNPAGNIEHARELNANAGVAAHRARRTPDGSARPTTDSWATITAAGLHTSKSGGTRRNPRQHIGSAPRHTHRARGTASNSPRHSANSGRHTSGPRRHTSDPRRHSSGPRRHTCRTGRNGISSAVTNTNLSGQRAALVVHDRGTRVHASISGRHSTNSGRTSHGAAIQCGVVTTHTLRDRGHTSLRLLTATGSSKPGGRCASTGPAVPC